MRRREQLNLGHRQRRRACRLPSENWIARPATVDYVGKLFRGVGEKSVPEQIDHGNFEAFAEVVRVGELRPGKSHPICA
jgi:hypothetical protein